jgi:hypothetical protein
MDHILIPLTRGLSARVDASVADQVLPFRWHAVAAGHTHYAARRPREGVVYMHRQVMGLTGPGRSVFVDHINHDGLDNTRANLRLCTPAENSRNRRTTTPERPAWAVQLLPSGGWQARISAAGRVLFLGIFGTEAEAIACHTGARKALARVESST